MTPDVTYILLGGDDNLRRIMTDGRDWPAQIEPTYQGYSIGHWIDENGDGTYDVLEAETRGPFKGPRAFDSTDFRSPRQRIRRSRNDSSSTNPIRTCSMT